MAKSSGSTKKSTSSAPRGLSIANNYSLGNADTMAEVDAFLKKVKMPAKGQSIRVSMGENDDGQEIYGVVSAPRTPYVNDHYDVEAFIGGKKVSEDKVYYEFGGTFMNSSGFKEHRTQNQSEATALVRKILWELLY